jgi:hypothetical protein
MSTRIYFLELRELLSVSERWRLSSLDMYACFHIVDIRVRSQFYICSLVLIGGTDIGEKVAVRLPVTYSTDITLLYIYIVVCRPVARQRPRNKQLYISRCRVMALQTTAATRQWLSRDHVVTPTDTNATIALKQRNGVFYAVRAEVL